MCACKANVSSPTFSSANLVINDPFIRRWEGTGGFIGLRDYATHVDDKELQVKIAIVEKYKERIPELVRKIESCHVSREAAAGKAEPCLRETNSVGFIFTPASVLNPPRSAQRLRLG